MNIFNKIIKLNYTIDGIIYYRTISHFTLFRFSLKWKFENFNIVKKNGFLKTHADFNYNSQLKKYRTITKILWYIEELIVKIYN